jgi:hypothetical protein
MSGAAVREICKRRRDRNFIYGESGMREWAREGYTPRVKVKRIHTVTAQSGQRSFSTVVFLADRSKAW